MDELTLELHDARPGDIDTVMSLVLGYHNGAGIDVPQANLRSALTTLLTDTGYGHIWLITSAQANVGYICLCFGFSLEFAGRDAFIDEFYVMEPYRGRGLGRAALTAVIDWARASGVTALHLEVSRNNTRLSDFYRAMGFQPRQRYNLLSRGLQPATDGAAG